MFKKITKFILQFKPVDNPYLRTQEYKENSKKDKNWWRVFYTVVFLTMIFLTIEANANIDSKYMTAKYIEIKHRLVIPDDPILCPSGENISHTITNEMYQKKIGKFNNIKNYMDSCKDCEFTHSIFDYKALISMTNYDFIQMRESKISLCYTKKKVQEILKETKYKKIKEVRENDEIRRTTAGATDNRSREVGTRTTAGTTDKSKRELETKEESKK